MEPGGKEKLKERNPKWINDDYVKFLRYGQHFIEKNGSGVLAFINPHGFLDNPTFRGMRWNLLKTYDKIYTMDLHGNAKKKEIALDGSADQNVFDIMQGVSINLFIKTGKKKTNELGRVFHFDLLGKRDFKYDFLVENSIKSILYKEVQNIAPNYFFVNKDFAEETAYTNGFSVNELFLINNVGIVTAKDSVLIKDTRDELIQSLSENYSIKINAENIKAITYRPFDSKFVYYDTKILERAREKVMQNFLNCNNIGLVIGRQGQVVGSMQWNLSFVTKNITDFNLYYRGGGVAFPLYQSLSKTMHEDARTPNLNMAIVNQMAEKLGLTFVPEKGTSTSSASKSAIEPVEMAPIDILDYIYAVLHSPSYREKYKEFLKIDFPRVPYPKDKATFWQLVKLGSQIREIHLLESPTVEKYITQYPIDGDNVVTKPIYKNGNVYINNTQYFANVPEVAWDFYIGGYQPAQKWLKDRKDRKLEFEEILRYQKIIVALSETDRLMKEIEEIIL
jgi:predicted helicase